MYNNEFCCCYVFMALALVTRVIFSVGEISDGILILSQDDDMKRGPIFWRGSRSTALFWYISHIQRLEFDEAKGKGRHLERKSLC